MVLADLAHVDHQVAMTPSFREAIDFLRRPGVHQLPDGRVEIDGHRIFALVQRYETVSTRAPKFEYHQKYIDVQYVASGEEIIGWSPAARMTITESYDEDQDICFGTAGPGAWTPVYLRAEQVAVLWPEDGHAPRLAAGTPSLVMKIVIKVAV